MSTLGGAERPLSDSSAESGAARLDELESKRLRYEELSRKLFMLPQKLRHAGLIPVGPRLYLPGELINTNRLTVLLGSCNEEAYFAERSAFQAQGIVQRRLALIDEKVKEVQVDQQDLEEALTAKATENGADRNNALLPGATVDVERNTVNKVKRRVSFSDPIVTEVHMPENYKKKKKGKKAGSPSNSLVRKQESTTKPKSPLQEQPNAQELPTTNGASGGDVVTAAAEPATVEDSSSAADVVAKHPSTAEVPSEIRAASAGKVPKDEISLREEQRVVRSQLNEAIRNAEQRVLEQGVVNITEVYDDGVDGPSRVELPSGFTPDKRVSFEEDSEEFLDITGGSSRKAEDNTETATREDFWEALIAAERDGEIENARKEAEETKKAIQSEERGFGKGLRRGFFGSPSVKASKAKSEAKSTTEVSEKVEVPPQVEHSPEVWTEDEVAQERVESPEQPVIKERVVERRPVRRKGGRKPRKPRASSTMERHGMPAAPVLPDMQAGNSAIVGYVDEDEDDVGDERPVSKFRQTRNRQRGSRS